MKWLLDTDAVSEAVRPRPDRNIMRWLNAIPPDDSAISLVTLAELQHGVLLTPDEMHRAKLVDWIDNEILPLFAGRVLPVTLDIAINWLELVRALAARRESRAPPDLLIAATARVHNLTLVTRNTRDFANTGITVYNPWTSETIKMEAP